MIFTIAITVMLAIPPEERTGLAVDNADRITLQHYHDDDGRHVFDQLLFEEATDTGFRIFAWRLVKSASQSPVSGHVIWHDGETMRHVKTKMFREVWGQTDLELRERNVYPKEMRRGLHTPRTITPHEIDLIEE